MILPFFFGCAHSGDLHPYLTKKGLLVPISDPDGLIDNPTALSLYLGDVFNARAEGGTVLSGQKLTGKLRQLLGGQVSETCRSLQCYANAAKTWNMNFLLSASIRREERDSRSEGVLTLTRWSVEPLIPDLTVPVVFPLGTSHPSFETLIDRAVKEFMKQAAERRSRTRAGSGSDETADFRKLIGEGKIDQALRVGELAAKNSPDASRSPEFYPTLYRLEMSAGNLERAQAIGEDALRTHRASPSLLLQMANDARRMGEPNRERNILFKGLALYPDDRYFWRQLIREEIRKKDFKQAYDVIRHFEKRNPSPMGHPRFRFEVYACLVGLGRGDEADLWYRQNIEKSNKNSGSPPLFFAHALVSRELEKGDWRTAEKKAKSYIARGIRSPQLYQDWITALGAGNNPIEEAHAAREAISVGLGSRWIRDQLAYLEQKGY